MAGQQFLDPIRPIRWQSCEYIFQTGIWAVSVYAIGLNQAHRNRRTLHGAQIPVKSHLDEISPAPDNPIDRDFQVATDNGIGIAPQALPILIYMFSQLPTGAARSQGGPGIGLSLVAATELG